MTRLVALLAGIVLGYLAGAALGAVAIEALSSNTHDKSVEAAMTAAFVTGPLGAVLGLAVAWLRTRRRD